MPVDSEIVFLPNTFQFLNGAIKRGVSLALNQDFETFQFLNGAIKRSFNKM